MSGEENQQDEQFNTFIKLHNIKINSRDSCT